LLLAAQAVVLLLLLLLLLLRLLRLLELLLMCSVLTHSLLPFFRPHTSGAVATAVVEVR
jgi:hypothetical protein